MSFVTICYELYPGDTIVILFNKYNSNAYLLNYLYVKLDPPKWIDTYTQNCKGDSGSGQFISNNKQLPEDVMEFRYILVAIHESSTKDLFKDKNGKLHNVPCGAYTYSRKTKKYLKSIGVSISTTWAKHLNWIKQKSNI